MFEVKQVIEGKIFIHHRRDEMLTVFHRHEVPAQYFECFINAQNFTGHFVEVHVQPADQVRVIYIQKNGQNKIIAMLNHTQQVLHLHPSAIIFSRWSWMHRVIPNLIKIIALSLILLTGFFFLVTASFERAAQDATLFSFRGLLLASILVGLPMFAFYSYRRAQTRKLLHLFALSPEHLLDMEKLNPPSRIYPLAKPVELLTNTSISNPDNIRKLYK